MVFTKDPWAAVIGIIDEDMVVRAADNDLVVAAPGELDLSPSKEARKC